MWVYVVLKHYFPHTTRETPRNDRPRAHQKYNTQQYLVGVIFRNLHVQI